ncbi:hypothetical protein [Nocardia amikacinitolerans]|uniref:hypothetical protein n=1 Tax=Nocardia amikacinitolerans TaxID=756689 RepID=UPI0020A2E0D6|nr:hypothetical protein [Nocardia amikacinitolerans]MCP2281074.1 hypothetical protein [Nocardia amikacinitolerans]
MPRRHSKSPDQGQDSMFPDLPSTDAVVRTEHGRHSKAVETAIEAARKDQALVDADEAALSLVRAGAWALDTFEAQNKPYGPSKLLGPVLDALKELRMTPETRASAQSDTLEELLRELATPDAAATVRDEARPE